MYSIGGCALARSTLRAIERGDASVGGAVRPVAAPAAARADAAPAAPAKLPSAPATAPASDSSAAGTVWSPLVWVVATLVVLGVLWGVLARGRAH
jgi:hypothetical protein